MLPLHREPDTQHNAENEDTSLEQTHSALPGKQPFLSPDIQKQQASAQSPSEESFVTAPSTIPEESGKEEGSDEEIDVDLLMKRPLGIESISSRVSSSSSSTRTVRPSETKDRHYINGNVQPTNIPSTSANREVPRLKKKKSLARIMRSNTLRWHKSGAVFVPTQRSTPPVAYGLDEVVKRDILLYTRSLSSHGANEPTRYKASHEARLGLFEKKWKQVELILTPSHLTVYSSSTFRWPRKRIEERISFQGSNRKPRLELMLLSSLDYTFCLRYAVDKAFAIITFRARSLTLCWEWYLAIYKLLPESCRRPCPLWCEVYVPLMDVRVYLPLVNKRSEPQYGITMDHVKEAVLAMFEEDPEWAQAAESQLGKTDLDMCWVHQDRLEWTYWEQSINGGKVNLAICPQSIEQTHQLQIRRAQHTPYDIRLKEDVVLEEPAPLEGFLRRVTDFQGHFIKSGRFIRRRFYFASFEQYLFYILPAKVSLINPTYYVPEDLETPSSTCPHAMMINAYGRSDRKASEEIQRRMDLLTNASGMIDLTDVAFVRRSFISEGFGPSDSSSIRADSITPVLFDRHGSLRRTGTLDNMDRSYLELVMENGLVIQFEAYSADKCTMWMDQLSKLIVYWKAHKEAQRDAHAQHNFSNTLQENLHLAHSENEESTNNSKDHKVVADTRIWSRCVFEQCRDVIKTGTMYFQPKSRGTFTQKIFVLTANGWLLYFDTYQRSPVSCQPVLTAAHACKGMIDIADAYVYSGELALPKERPNRPPRLFKSGLTTADSDEACVFSLWKPKARRYFSPKRKRLTVYTHDYSSSPFRGDTWVFLAESRQEMEEWVWAINTVIETLVRSKSQQPSQ
ncbi:hypothetical protein EC973_001569 [Apophysomyces ossiformis]|uniref:PH domain-containing protein n=1 Tax=Apophysomyces ossiformis TaxID=679940 RepID=A0A8H7BJH5_9FUNG|nr:hypothetical protein EC973_001569 [Apophysomyces ossiformis]